MFNLANRITLARVLIVPLIIVLLYFPSKMTCFFATILFIIASVTDWLDGYVARKSNLVTSFGKFLDPLADKLLICSVLIMMVELTWVPAWVCIIIIGREMLITGLRAVAADEGIVIAADKFGKMKTVMQIAALIPLLLHYPWFGIDLNPIGYTALYIALALTVYSGFNYLKGFYTHWLQRD